MIEFILGSLAMASFNLARTGWREYKAEKRAKARAKILRVPRYQQDVILVPYEPGQIQWMGYRTPSQWESYDC